MPTQRELNIFTNRTKDVLETADVAAAMKRAVDLDPNATDAQKQAAASIQERADDVVAAWDWLRTSLGA